MARREDLVTQRSGSFLPIPPRDSNTVSGGDRAGKAKLRTEIEMSLDTVIRVVRRGESPFTSTSSCLRCSTHRCSRVGL